MAATFHFHFTCILLQQRDRELYGFELYVFAGTTNLQLLSRTISLLANEAAIKAI
jgi:hypothetical protein